MEFFLIIDGKKTGPHSAYALNGMVRDGVVTKETKGWHSGMDEWLPMGEMPAVESLFKEPEPRDPVEGEDGENGEKDIESGTASPPRRPSIVPGTSPFRRYLARMVDLQIVFVLTMVVEFKLGVISAFEAYQLPTAPVIMRSAAILILLESLCLLIFRTTPGKAFLSLHVSVEGKMDLARSLKRSIAVWWRGFGIGFPIAAMVTMTLSYFNLVTTGTTTWDSACGTQVKSSKIEPLRILLLIVMFFSLSKLMLVVLGPPPEGTPYYVPPVQSQSEEISPEL